MRPALYFSLLSVLLPLSSATFLISNTTLCMGSFPFTSCMTGVQVLTRGDGTSNPTNNTSSSSSSSDYTCESLVPAEDEHYVRPDAMGPLGAAKTHVDGDFCGAGRLEFVRDGPEYIVFDEGGDTVGNCREVNRTLERKCPQLLGNIYFWTAFECEGRVCS